jgi:hypothetical protein
MLFDVDGVAYDNTSPTGHYYGAGYMLIPITAEKATITNVRKKSDGSVGSLWVYGITGSTATVPKLTGKGAWTSGQILAEYSTLVQPYSPDVVFYIIGANDIGLNAVATFKSNLTNFVSNVRTTRPNAIVILISTPPTSSFSKATAMPYITAGREVALEMNTSFIDLWAALESIPSSYYRFDNIHFSASGDALVFNIVKNLVLTSVPIVNKKFAIGKGVLTGAGGVSLRQDNANFSATILAGAAPSVVLTSNLSATDKLALSYVVAAGYIKKMVIVAPLGFKLSSISTMLLGAPYGRTVKIATYPSAIECHVFLCNGDTAIDIQGSGVYIDCAFTQIETALS